MNRKQSIEKQIQMVRCRIQGDTLQTIATAFNCSRQNVHEILRDIASRLDGPRSEGTIRQRCKKRMLVNKQKRIELDDICTNLIEFDMELSND